jgi:hypothetical protein
MGTLVESRSDRDVARAIDALLGESMQRRLARRFAGRLIAAATALSAIPIGLSVNQLSSAHPFAHLGLAGWVVLLISSATCLLLAVGASVSLWTVRMIADRQIHHI